MTHYLDSVKLSAYLSGAWVDLTPDVIKDNVSSSYGMMDNTPFDRLAKTGRLTFQLKNTTNKYAPDHASALSGWKRGVPVILTLTYENFPYIKFRGMVEDIDITTGLKAHRVYVTALN
jgi:hypothetical protein